MILITQMDGNMVFSINLYSLNERMSHFSSQFSFLLKLAASGQPGIFFCFLMFFLPLSAAVLHVMVAFPVLCKVLRVFSIWM